MESTRIHVNYTGNNPVTGSQRWSINAKNVAKLLTWEGFDIAKVRGSRGIRKDGTLHFTTGSGYAIFDADLLGGNGDGTAERNFNNAGFTIR